jgi:hypothetical protein
MQAPGDHLVFTFPSVEVVEVRQPSDSLAIEMEEVTICGVLKWLLISELFRLKILWLKKGDRLC